MLPGHGALHDSSAEGQEGIAAQSGGEGLANEVARLEGELQAAKLELEGQKVWNSSERQPDHQVHEWLGRGPWLQHLRADLVAGKPRSPKVQTIGGTAQQLLQAEPFV